MSDTPTNTPPALAHETSGAPLKPLLLGAALLAAFTLLALVASLWVFHFFLDRELPGARLDHPLAAERELPPEPRLEADPAASLHEQRAIEQERLSTWRWVDRTAGVVAIPIEHAMERIAAEGLPVLRRP